MSIGSGPSMHMRHEPCAREAALKTKREVVELGLKTLLRLKQQSEIRRLRGKITWEMTSMR